MNSRELSALLGPIPACAIDYPGLGRYYLTGPQLLVVRELMSALLHSRSPDVNQGHLLRVAGLPARRLLEVFRPAWGELVIPGRAAGSYRLYAPPVDDGPDGAA